MVEKLRLMLEILFSTTTTNIEMNALSALM